MTHEAAPSTDTRRKEDPRVSTETDPSDTPNASGAAMSRAVPRPRGDDAGPRYTASDVPRLRRDLAEWYGGPNGVGYYQQAIQLGRQPMRPPGPAAQAARHLAAAETARLRDGDLWFVDEDLCALLAAAHTTMPPFAPRPQDLPSRAGFALFADPIDAYPAEQARDDRVIERLARTGESGFREMTDKLWQAPTAIVAVSWSPLTQPDWPAGGLWMSFYSVSQLHARDDLFDDPRAQARARSMVPPLTVDNEAGIRWRPDDAPAEPFLLPGPDATTTTLSWARLVFAVFQLAAQANLAEREELRTSRPERRRAEKAGLPPRDVRVIRLRRSLEAERNADSGSGGRDWRHRWIVRGHWRQHWYPRLGDHRPLWIAPYLKGPADAPLIGGDKVTVLSPQPGDPA